MDAASVILDLMDDQLAYLGPTVMLVVLLLLITIAAGVWVHAGLRTVRYGVAAVVLVALLLAVAAVGLRAFQASEPPRIPPMTPTPTAVAGALWSAPGDGRFWVVDPGVQMPSARTGGCPARTAPGEWRRPGPWPAC